MKFRQVVFLGLAAVQLLTGAPVMAWCIASGQAEKAPCCCGNGACPTERGDAGGIKSGCCDLASSSPRTSPGNPSSREVVPEGFAGGLPAVPTLHTVPALPCQANRILTAPEAPAFSPPLYELFSSYLI